MPDKQTPADYGFLTASVPHLDEYFGLWAILEQPFRTAVERVNGVDLAGHIRSRRALVEVNALEPGPAEESYEDRFPIESGVAVIDLTGPLMKYVSSFSGGTSTVIARRQIRSAARREDVSAILLRIDSPGGTVSGTEDLAADVAAAAKQKSLIAYIEDLGASAAYYVASQASKVYSNSTGAVGSIGTYGVIYDFSARAAMAGIKVYILRGGKFKGAGELGTEITAEQLAEWQRLVDQYYGFFVGAVAQGRRLSAEQVAALADGRVHIGEDAAQLGLTDGVRTIDEVMSELSVSTKRRTPMADLVNTAKQGTALSVIREAASYEELRICCPGADSDFICGQLERKATVDQAQSAWMEEQDRQIKALAAEKEQATRQAQQTGVEPVGSGGGGTGFDGDPVTEFSERVRKRMASGQQRCAAALAVAREDPELHQAYLQATNQGKSRKVQELIDERFELSG